MNVLEIATKEDVQRIESMLRSISAIGEPEEIFTPKQAAEYLEVSVDTLENWRNGRVDKNPLPCYGKGKVIRYLKSDCLKYLKSHPIR